jgi:hypothetical protein
MAPKVSLAPEVPMAPDDTDAAAPVAEMEAEAAAPLVPDVPKLPTVNARPLFTTVPPVLLVAVWSMVPVVAETPAPATAELLFELDDTEAPAPVAEIAADVPLPVRFPPTAEMVPLLVMAPVFVAAEPIAPNVVEAGVAVTPVVAIAFEETADVAPLVDTDNAAPWPVRPPVTPVTVPVLVMADELFVV